MVSSHQASHPPWTERRKGTNMGPHKEMSTSRETMTTMDSHQPPTSTRPEALALLGAEQTRRLDHYDWPTEVDITARLSAVPGDLEFGMG